MSNDKYVESLIAQYKPNTEKSGRAKKLVNLPTSKKMKRAKLIKRAYALIAIGRRLDEVEYRTRRLDAARKTYEKGVESGEQRTLDILEENVALYVSNEEISAYDELARALSAAQRLEEKTRTSESAKVLDEATKSYGQVDGYKKVEVGRAELLAFYKYLVALTKRTMIGVKSLSDEELRELEHQVVEARDSRKPGEALESRITKLTLIGAEKIEHFFSKFKIVKAPTEEKLSTLTGKFKTSKQHTAQRRQQFLNTIERLVPQAVARTNVSKAEHDLKLSQDYLKKSIAYYKSPTFGTPRRNR